MTACCGRSVEHEVVGTTCWSLLRVGDEVLGTTCLGVNVGVSPAECWGIGRL